MSQMGDFGIGIGIYFSTTMALAIILFIAGILRYVSSLRMHIFVHFISSLYMRVLSTFLYKSLPNIIYLSSTDYSSDNYVHDNSVLLESSAMCADQSFVPCPDCPENKWDDDDALNRFGYAEGSNETLAFAKHNECEGAQTRLGMVNVVVIIFLVISLSLFSQWQSRQEEAFDIDEQTAQDYSIVVDDAPPDVINPDVWKEYFERLTDGEHVTVVTLSLNNGPLVKALVKHRLLKKKLRHLVFDAYRRSNNYSLDNLDHLKLLAEASPKVPAWIRYLFCGCCFNNQSAKGKLPSWFKILTCGLVTDAVTVYEEYVALETYIETLSQQNYEVTDVFITFENESGQRLALQKLDVGSYNIMRQHTSHVPQDILFGADQVLLSVSEPAEPSAIRWADLATDWMTRLKGLCLSFILTILGLIISAFIVSQQNGAEVALYIALMNGIFPFLCRTIVNFETHPDEGDRSLSLYWKVTLFRWVNTAVIIFAATPFTHSLSDNDDDLIPSIYRIFFAELLAAPAIILSDPLGHFEKHIMAPRYAKTQDEINSYMRGTIYEVAERYTTVTKLLFLAFFYAAMYPMGFFVCSLALCITYFADKFATFRIWRPAPMLGNEVSEFQRNWVFPVVLLALILVTGYLYAMFPYDFLCESEDPVPEEYYGENYTVIKKESDDGGSQVQVTVDENSTAYRYCDQNIFVNFYFPPRSQAQDGDNWMTGQQEFVVNFVGWFGFTCFFIIVVLKFGVSSYKAYKSWIYGGGYEPVGDDQGIPFSKVESITAYVPQVRSDAFVYPLLACDVIHVDGSLIGFTDPEHENDHSVHSLIHEFRTEQLKAKAKDVNKPILGVVKHYPPNAEESMHF